MVATPIGPTSASVVSSYAATDQGSFCQAPLPTAHAVLEVTCRMQCHRCCVRSITIPEVQIMHAKSYLSRTNPFV